MKTLRFLSQLVSHPARRDRHRENNRRVATLEMLEGRALLTTFSWNSASSGDFNVAANWTSDTNPPVHAVPGPGDDALIPTGDYTVTVSQNTAVNSINTNDTTINVTSGTLSVGNVGNQASSSLGNLMVASGASFTTSGGSTTIGETGTISGNLNVAAAGNLNISSAASQFTLDAGATLTGSGNFDAQINLFINAAITAPQHLEINSLGNGIEGPGTLTVPAGATLDWQNGDMAGLGGVTNIAAGATLLIDGPSNATFYLIDRTLNNAGTITYSSAGNFNFQGQATLNNSASFAITNDSVMGYSGGTINNTGTITKTSPSGVGMTTIKPTFNNSGTVTATSGILDLNSNGIDTGVFSEPTTAGSIEIDANNGSFNYNLNAGATFTGAGSLLLNSADGVLINSSLTIPNVTDDYGTIEGTGSLTVTGTLTTDNAYIDLTGTLTLPAGSKLTIFGANNTTTFNNLTVNDAGTSTLSGTDNFALAGTAVFNNSGTFTIANDGVNSGGGFNLNGATFNNTGTLLKTTTNAPSGRSVIQNGLFKDSGKVSVVSGQLQLDIQGTITGQLDSETNATLLLTNTMNFNAGTSLTGPGLIENGDGTTTANGNITVNANVSANRLKFINQSLTVSPGDTFTITTFNFAGGTIQGTGTVVIPAGGVIAFTSPTSDSISGTTLSISGTANWLNVGSIGLNSGAVLNINGSSTFNVTNDQSITGGSGGTVDIYGKLIKTSLTGVGTTTIGVPVNILPGGSINLVSGNLATGSLINVGTISLGSETILTDNGTYQQPNAGTLNIAVGGAPNTALFGQLNVSSTGTLNGTLNVTQANHYLPTVGQTFPILTFSSRTGNFTTVNTPNNGIGTLYATSPLSTGVNLVDNANVAQTAPTLAIDPADDTSGPGVTAIYQPRLTGTAQPNQNIQIYTSGGSLVAAGVTNAGGTYLVTSLSSLAPGTYTLTAYSIDNLGDYKPGAPFILTITPPPPAPTGLSIYPADDTGGAGSTTTSNLRPRLTGTAQTGQNTLAAGLTVDLWEIVGNQGILVGTGTTNTNGVFVITPYSPFSLGTHNLFAVAIDAGGHFGTNSAVQTITIT